MNAGAAAANLLWLARGRGAARRFAAALDRPRDAQAQWLFHQVRLHARSEYGRAHDFSAIDSIAEFRRRVPLASPGDVAPWVARIRRGEPDVLTCDLVTHLVPTSGTTGARKLVPFSRGLQQGFDAAIAAWMRDLARLRPRILWGPAYWSVTPLAADDIGGDDQGTPAGSVRIGFADDADYLGGAATWLVRRVMAAPSSLRHERDPETFWHRTLAALLARRDLRLLSIWHPSFLDLLIAAARRQWAAVLDGLETSRARELAHIGPEDWPRWWPDLQVVSCWGDQAAAPGHRALQARLPHVLVQAKGLLATEAVVTVPYAGAHVLAVTSHHFEFLDEAGGVHGADALARGGRYEVVVTNGGGLWRYRLGDVVECTGHVGGTPALRFLGRAGRSSDLRGEKLSEPFVAEVLRSVWPAALPAYLALRAWDGATSAGYELLVSADDLPRASADLAGRLDDALAANPHYAVARRLGQLSPPRVVAVARDHGAASLAATTGRLGDVKPEVLIPAGAGR
ncbi:MAG: GH3 auxin-responsive promoter family protein [Vicinamibacterales bacterium]